MRRPRTRLAGTVGVTLLALFAPAEATEAGQGDDVHRFEVRVVGTGSAVADYGEDRLTAGSSTSGVDGKSALQWRWEVRAVAYSVGAGGLVTRAQEGRERAVSTASVISWSKGMSEVSTEPLCDKRQGTTIVLSDDGQGRSPRKRGRGEFVDEARFTLRGGEITASAPFFPSLCFHGAATEHDLIYTDGAHYDEAPVPRGAFNPRSDRDYSETFGPVKVSHDKTQSADLNSAHDYVAESKLEVRIDSISARRFNRLVKKYQRVPVEDDPNHEAEYNEPPPRPGPSPAPSSGA